jgi:tetratricopeptide (TPR) repeat protein
MRTVLHKRVHGHFYSFSFILFSILFSSCGQQQDKTENVVEPRDTARGRASKNFLTDCGRLLTEAKHIDSILLKENEINMSSAEKGIAAFMDYAVYCHDDTLSPVYLIKCAQVARAVNRISVAKEALEKCLQDYPRFNNRPAALFLLAQLYDETIYLNNEQKAKELYEQIISEYPKSDWAVSARGALQFIGKTDAEIMQALKAKAGSKK